MMGIVDLDDEAFLVGDRGSVYARMRAEAPFFRIPVGTDSSWVVSRYHDVYAILRNPTGRMQPPGLRMPPWIEEGPVAQRLQANLTQMDPPDHTRLRKLVQPIFTGRFLENLRGTATTAVAELLETVARKSQIDAVTDLAGAVPKTVTCALLGLPEADWEDLVAIQHDFLLIFSRFPLTPDELRRLDAVVRQYFGYFESILARRSGPPSELVARLLAAESEGERLTRTDVVSVMHTVLDAGYETTRTSISNAIVLLASHPDQLRAVHEAPVLAVNAAEEVLRFSAPAQYGSRYLTEPYEFDGGRIERGEQALLFLAAANRDEAVFTDPERFDVRRENAKAHLSFGGGRHHCLGAYLARMQLQETIAAVAARFPRLTLAGPTARYPSLMFPSLSSAPITLDPQAQSEPTRGEREQQQEQRDLHELTR